MEQYLDNLCDFFICLGIMSIGILILMGIGFILKHILILLGWYTPIINFMENLFNEATDGNND